MSRSSFALIPFPAPNIPKVTIAGEISHRNGLLSLCYCLRGEIGKVSLPPPSLSPGRKDELWKTTCFEFFLAVKDQPQYWEFNLSPSGDWNAYHMDAYRRMGFREERSIQGLQFEARKQARTFTLEAIVDLKPILPASAALQAGITAILQSRDGNATYWALRHTAGQADFHLKESFICSL